MLTLRPYQQQAVNAVFEWFEGDGHSSNPLIVLPTGTGKSLVLSDICRRSIAEYGEMKIVVVTHVMELIKQNHDEMLALWPKAPVGIYSAGIGRREHQADITFCGIQSVHSKAHLFQKVDWIIIDEVHLCGRKTNTMYQKFLKSLLVANPHMKIIGLTATPYRMDTGMLHTGDGALFDDICYEYPVLDAIKEGYLCNLITKQTSLALNTAGVHTRGGEFIASELQDALDLDEINDQAVDEILTWADNRKSWLIFGSGVEHAQHLCDRLVAKGVNAKCIFGETPKDERADIIAAFKRGEVTALCSMGVLTTGFNAPNVDLIAVLRPTQSPGLYVQIIGRGMRNAPGKADCIAEGQRVLTDVGLVEIQNITTDMKVWDGVAFVNHCGIVFRGERDVITYAGLTATEDHRVWTKEGWKTLGMCSVARTPICVTGNGKQKIREIDGYFRNCNQEKIKGTRSLINKMHNLWSGIFKGLHKSFEENCWLPEMWAPETSPSMACAKVYKRKEEMHKSEGLGLRKIWGERNKIQIQVSDHNGGVDNKQSWIRSKLGDRQNKQRWSLRTWKLAFGKKKIESVQSKTHEMHDKTSPIQDESSRNKIFGFDFDRILFSENFARKNNRKILQKVVQTKRRVWDILNAGPRNSFTVEGLLVHNCIILDFARNIQRHGPVDMARVKKGPHVDRPPEGSGPLVKTCPACKSIVHLSLMQCPDCGFEFPQEIKLVSKATDLPVLSTGAVSHWVDVDDVRYSVHTKMGKPPSLKATYFCGFLKYHEWVCLEHFGYARTKAESWWTRRAGTPAPATVAEGISRQHELTAPLQIEVIRKGSFDEIVKYKFPVSPVQAGVQGVSLRP